MNDMMDFNEKFKFAYKTKIQSNLSQNNRDNDNKFHNKK